MHIHLAGISHKTATVDVRDRYSFGGQDLIDALHSISRAYPNAVLLSTCNRTEVYLTGDRPAVDICEIVRLLGESRGGDGGDAGAFYSLADEDAVRHLFRVAAGIDSMVLGEAEILGQVRSAFQTASAAGTCDRVLSKLFHAAIRCGRKARAETRISQNALSVSSLAANLAKRALGDLSARSVLVIGAGQAGKLAARGLMNQGLSNVIVTSRTFENAKALAEELDGVAVPFEEMDEVMRRSDVVITSATAPGFLIDRPAVEEMMRDANGKSLMLIDIAVPRNIDPAVAEIPNVHLYDIDDLQDAFRENLVEREQEVVLVEGIIDQELGEFADWRRSLDVLATVADLREKAERIRRDQLAQTARRIGRLSEDEYQALDAMTSAIIKKLLHAPIACLKSSTGNSEYAETVRELFGLDPAAERKQR